MTFLPAFLGAAKPRQTTCALSAKGAWQPFLRRFLEESWRIAHHAPPHRTRRAPHHAGQVGDDPESAEAQAEGCFPGRILSKPCATAARPAWLAASQFPPAATCSMPLMGSTRSAGRR